MNELAEIRADLFNLREERALMDSAWAPDLLKRSNINLRICERRLDLQDCLHEQKDRIGMAGYIGKDKVARAALINFKADVSQERAAKALRTIADVLETNGDPGDLVTEYDVNYGGPVWYIPWRMSNEVRW